MIKGTVKFFNGSKGFGFVTPDDGGKEIFLPSVAIAGQDIGLITAGRRVQVETEAEAKGPKAVKLKILDEKPQVQITIYHDPAGDESADILAELKAAKIVPKEHDYMASPPAGDELKRLSMMLRDADQTLARRYEPLFMALQLDDRFISDVDFWTAISEHPSLINGPVLVAEGRARVCKTPGDVRSFLDNRAGQSRTPRKISGRLAAMIAGRAQPPAPRKETRAVERPAESPAIAKPKTKKVPAKAPAERKKKAPAVKKVPAKRKIEKQPKPKPAKKPKR